MRVDPVTDEVLPRRGLCGLGDVMEAPFTGVVVALSKLNFRKLCGGAEMRLLLPESDVRFENTGIGTGTGCSCFAGGTGAFDDMGVDIWLVIHYISFC